MSAVGHSGSCLSSHCPVLLLEEHNSEVWMHDPVKDERTSYDLGAVEGMETLSEKCFGVWYTEFML